MSTEKANVKPVKKTAVKPSLSTGKKTLSTGEKAKVKTASPSVGVAKKVVKKPVVKPAVKPAVKTDATALVGASTTASKPGIKRLAGGGFAKMVKVRKPDGTIAKKLVRCDENGNIIKPQKKAVAGAVASKPEQTASLNLASMLKNGSAKTDETPAVNEKTEDKAPAENVGETNKNKDFDRSKFLSRVRSRHSFLSALDEGKKASEVTNIETARVDEAPKQVNTGEYVEEQIETDASVTNLENSVLNKQLDNMTGQGDSKGVSTSASQLGVSGQAKNPNASKTNSPISNANSVKSQNLTGSFVNLASRDSGYVLPEATRKVKERKKVKPWVVCVSVASAIVIAFVTVFLCTYNFGPKHVNILTYELKVGETARTKYYDGELIDFGNINMEFMTNGADAVTYGLSLASIGEIAEDSGYKINEGCLVVDWTGVNAEKSSVMVSIPVVCNEQSSVLHLEVFRNKLVSMSSLSNVTSLSAGARIYPNIFGTYENSEIVGEEKLVFALSVADYTLMANIGTIADPEWVDLKTVDGAFDNLNKCFIIPTKVGEDFVTVVGLKAVYTGTYFNAGEGDKFVAGEEDKLVELVLA